jgi:hypothetical protein
MRRPSLSGPLAWWVMLVARLFHLELRMASVSHATARTSTNLKKRCDLLCGPLRVIFD